MTLSIIAGEFMYKGITESQNLQVAFVWNRSLDKVKGIVPDDLILENLDDFANRYVRHAGTQYHFDSTHPF